MGSVSFYALSEDITDSLRAHFSLVSGCAPITRRRLLQLWAFGKLWVAGFRQPRGGRPGDTYDLYAQHTTSTNEGIQALFAHATVSVIVRYSTMY